MGKLSGYFDEKLTTPRDFAVHQAQSIRDIGSGSDDAGAAAISATFDVLRTSYRVDYSDRSNFVFFNSALDYFNISGEKIINEFPMTGTAAEYISFLSGCDGYQRYLIENSWPCTLGKNGTNTVLVKDPDSLLNPRTGSFSVEMYTNPFNFTLPSTIFQNTGTLGGYKAYVKDVSSTATLYFEVSGTSGSAGVSYNVQVNFDAGRYLSFVYDSDSKKILIVHAPSKQNVDDGQYTQNFTALYPFSCTVLASAAADLGDVNCSGGLFVLASGSYGTFQNNISEFSYWNKARSVAEIANSFAGDIRKQTGLIVQYRFDENIQNNDGSYFIRDRSGNSLHGIADGPPQIRTYFGIKVPFESLDSVNLSNVPTPMTSFGQGGVLSNVLENYIAEQQLSASLYDKSNTNIITRMVPETYLQLEEDIGTDVLEKFLYLIARQFDEIKVAIDQFKYWNKSNYTGFNDTPDALLRDAANFYGWDFVGNFLNHDALKYFFGKGVIPGSDLEIKLYQVKNEFWRRTLNELMHIYKTKGTRESVESLIKVYGLDSKIVKLKEYGVKPVAKIETQRINSHKSIPALVIRSGSFETVTGVDLLTSDMDGFEISLHGRFLPFDGTSTLTSSILNLGPYELKYSAEIGSTTATLTFWNVVSSEIGAMGSIPITDGHWWNIFATLPNSGTMIYGSGFSSQFSFPFGSTISGAIWPSAIIAQRLEEDTVVDRYVISGALDSALSGTSPRLTVGHTYHVGSQMYINEVKLYKNYFLDYTELDAQTLDFQSYGTMDPDDLDSLLLHWKLDDDFTLQNTISQNDYRVYDSSGNNYHGYPTNFTYPDVSYKPFKRDLIDYNFIAPVEYGWNEDKVRVYEGSQINIGDRFNETNALALEFNLVDALNEDISKMLATLDNWNNLIGVPANKYRESYPDLQKYRNYYFKKLEGRINFRKFSDILEFFDRSFVKMIQKLLPARAIFYGEEFVVESHMLERPKVQWVYRRYNPELVPEGVITMTDRSGSDSMASVISKVYG